MIYIIILVCGLLYIGLAYSLFNHLWYPIMERRCKYEDGRLCDNGDDFASAVFMSIFWPAAFVVYPIVFAIIWFMKRFLRVFDNVFKKTFKINN